MSLPKTPTFSLKGKRAIVTGASSGIGLACAAALGESGAEVTLVARRADLLEDLEAEMCAEGMAATSLPMDVTDISSMQKQIASNGPFDVLVNSAGMARHSPALDTGEEDFDAVANLNFKSAYFLLQAVAKGLIAANKPGSLITISSQMALVGGIDRAVYAATKHAVEGFTKSMAIEWGSRSIRVNSICPTFIVTPLTRQTFERPERRKWVEGNIKLGRVGQVEDIMGAVKFLASDASALVTGSALVVDGGWTAD
ncbi:MAG: SDR family oxidoreductase [Opitutae bacterium]|jgi:NAD(P)-dependent dehydrogenase (short-subunit alcohol dehydrogenase family)